MLIWALCFRKESWPVSRLLVYLIPFLVIAIFMAMARYERRFAHDPTHRGFFERNGTVLGIVFIALVALLFIFSISCSFLLSPVV